MMLSPREREILALLRSQPQLTAAGIARALGTTKGAIAVALSALTQKGAIIGRGYLLRENPWAVVVGGAAWDIKARSLAEARLATSNPGRIARTPGGVGRNIAEGIARLGGDVHLIAAIGNDAAGHDLLARTSEAGVQVDRVVESSHPTGSYLAALDDTGELLIGIADFAATDALDVSELARSKDLIANADVVVVDGNVPLKVVDWVLAVAGGGGARVVLEPVSVAKAARIAPLIGSERPVFTVTPNLDELGALIDAEVIDTPEAIHAAATRLHDRGVAHVWVSRGAQGSLLCSEGESEPVTLPAPRAEVVDVTGAGDSMMAGFVFGILNNESPLAAAQIGQQVAALTVASPHTVRPDLGIALADLRRTDQNQGV